MNLWIYSESYLHQCCIWLGCPNCWLGIPVPNTEICHAFVWTVVTDTLYHSSKRLKQVQCILACSLKMAWLGRWLFIWTTGSQYWNLPCFCSNCCDWYTVPFVWTAETGTVYIGLQFKNGLTRTLAFYMDHRLPILEFAMLSFELLWLIHCTICPNGWNRYSVYWLACNLKLARLGNWPTLIDIHVFLLSAM